MYIRYLLHVKIKTSHHHQTGHQKLKQKFNILLLLYKYEQKEMNNDNNLKFA